MAPKKAAKKKKPKSLAASAGVKKKKPEKSSVSKKGESKKKGDEGAARGKKKGRKGSKKGKKKEKKKPLTKREQELAKVKAEKEAQEKAKADAIEAAQKAKIAAEENAKRAVQLLESGLVINQYDKVIYAHLQKLKKLLEWEFFIACHDTPDISNLIAVNSYMTEWILDLQEPSLDAVFQHVPGILEVVEQLKIFLQIPPETIKMETLHELGLMFQEFQEKLQEYLDDGTYHFIENLTDYYDPELGVFEFIIKNPQENISHAIWGNLYGSPGHTEHEYTSHGFSFRIPDSIAMNHGVFRLLKTNYDHYSDKSNSHYAPGVDNALKQSIMAWQTKKNEGKKLAVELKSPEDVSRRRRRKRKGGKKKKGRKGKKGKKGKGKGKKDKKKKKGASGTEGGTTEDSEAYDDDDWYDDDMTDDEYNKLLESGELDGEGKKKKKGRKKKEKGTKKKKEKKEGKEKGGKKKKSGKGKKKKKGGNTDDEEETDTEGGEAKKKKKKGKKKKAKTSDAEDVEPKRKKKTEYGTSDGEEEEDEEYEDEEGDEEEEEEEVDQIDEFGTVVKAGGRKQKDVDSDDETKKAETKEERKARRRKEEEQRELDEMDDFDIHVSGKPSARTSSAGRRASTKKTYSDDDDDYPVEKEHAKPRHSVAPSTQTIAEDEKKEGDATEGQAEAGKKPKKKQGKGKKKGEKADAEEDDDDTKKSEGEGKKKKKKGKGRSKSKKGRKGRSKSKKGKKSKSRSKSKGKKKKKGKKSKSKSKSRGRSKSKKGKGKKAGKSRSKTKSSKGSRSKSAGKKKAGDKKKRGKSAKSKSRSASKKSSKGRSKTPKKGKKGGSKGKKSKSRDKSGKKSKSKSKSKSRSKSKKGKKGKKSRSKSKKGKKGKKKSKSKEKKDRSLAEKARERERQEKAPFIPKTLPNELNLRKYFVNGGIYNFRMLHVPPQPKVRGEWTLHQMEDQRIMKEIPFVEEYTDPPLPDIDTEWRNSPEGQEVAAKEDDYQKLVQLDVKLPEIILNEHIETIQANVEKLRKFELDLMEKYEEEKENLLNKLITISVKLPEESYWFDAPLPVRWEAEQRIWSKEGFYNVKYDPETFTLNFRTSTFGVLGYACNRWANLPYTYWELKPMEPNRTKLILKGQHISLEFTIFNDVICVSSIQDVPQNQKVLDALLNVYMKPGLFIQTLRSHGIDVFPEFDSYAYMDGILIKQTDIEDHIYQCMAIVSPAYNFCWSQWNNNKIIGREKMVFQMQHKSGKGEMMMVINSFRITTFVDCTETSKSFSEEPKPGLEFTVDLLQLVTSTGGGEVKEQLRNAAPPHVEAIRLLLLSVRPLSFS